MRSRDTDAIPLAPRPDVSHYRKLARELTTACRTGEPAAVRAWAAGWIGRLARLQSESRTPYWIVAGDPDRPDQAAMERDVEGIVESARQAHLVGDDARAASLTDAQLFLARLHGFPSWPRLVKHIESGRRGDSPIATFEAAADAIVTGDLAVLRALLHQRPRLVHERSSREHRATLLHYVAANGHETFRQRTPRNAVAIARLLLESGATVDATARMYDRDCTTMEMLVSSIHPHASGVQVALVETLLDFGAAVNGVRDDGSPLMTALRFEYPDAAGALARRGARVDNVISAAALGRVELVDRMVGDDGHLQPGVQLAGVPWPSLPPEPAVHVATALAWACTFGHTAVVELLLRKGVDPSAGDGEATALHHAAAHGRLDCVRLLLAHGAPLEARNRHGGTVLDGTLWYAFNDAKAGVDYAAVVQLLLDAGARTDVYPEMRGYAERVLEGKHPGGHPPP